MIAVGFASNKASLERLPGWEQESWAYHGDDGKTFSGESPGQGRAYGQTFGVHDTIGCGVNFSTGSAFFTKNGDLLGKTVFLNCQRERELIRCLLKPTRKRFSGFEEREALPVNRS